MQKETYCLSCRKNTENTNLKIVKSRNNIKIEFEFKIELPNIR